MIIRALIGIPTYNNPKTIAAVVSDCLAHSELPILVIDDGSDLPVQKILQDAGLKLNTSRLQVLRIEINSGKGIALAQAFTWAVARNFTHLLSLDGDGQHKAECIAALTDKLKDKPWDLIIGVREMNTTNVPDISKFGRNFSNFWVQYQTGLKINDSQSGLRIYPLFHVQHMKFICRHYDFEIEILIRLLWNKVSFSEVVVPVYYPPPKLRVSHFKKFRDNLRISILNTLLVVLSLFKQENSPKKIGLSLALGVFIGCTPFFGFHAPLALLLAFLLRLNPLILILGTQISIPPLIPFLIFGSLTIGNFLMGLTLPALNQLPNLATTNLFFKSWFLGSLILGSCLGVIVYFLVWMNFKWLGKKRSTAKTWTGKSRGGAFGHWFIKTMTIHVGLKVAYFCLIFISPYFYLFAPRARHASLEYWALIVPKSSKLKRHLYVLKHFYRFGTVLIDQIYLTHKGSNFFKYDSDGFENLEMATSTGGILLGAHMGGWNIALQNLTASKQKSSFMFSQYSPQAQANNDPSIFFNEAGLPIITLYSMLREGKVIGLMADRPLENQYELISFFGKLAVFDSTPFRMAKVCQVPLLVSFGFKKSRDTYEFKAFQLKPHNNLTKFRSTEIYQSMQDYVALIENELIKYPDQWFNFYPFWSAPPASPVVLKSKKAQHHLQAELYTRPTDLPGADFVQRTNDE